ncbi:hypothetical protein ACC713_37435, partial [Rhizobium johnstonii]
MGLKEVETVGSRSPEIFDIFCHPLLDHLRHVRGCRRHGNALATLKLEGLIPNFARNVHHIDQFADPRLIALQDRAIDA